MVADGWQRDVLQYLREDGDLTAYLFRCRQCGAQVAYADAG
ncbi:MAG: CbrC family protein [Nocardioides sp.]